MVNYSTSENHGIAPNNLNERRNTGTLLRYTWDKITRLDGTTEFTTKEKYHIVLLKNDR